MVENSFNSMQLSRRSLLRGIGIGGGLVVSSAVLAACAPVASSSRSTASALPVITKPVTLQLDWIPFGRHAPYYAAKELGYYAQAGVDMTLLQGSGVGPGYSALVSGQADVSFNDLSYLPQTVAQQNIDLVATSVFYAVAPHSVFYLKSSGIKKPKDLEGKTIAYTAGTSPYLLFPFFAKANGVDASKVKWQQVSPQALNQTFLSGQADAMVTYAITEAVLDASVQNGDTVELFMYGKYNVSLLNNGLIFTKKYLDANPNLAKGITQATVKGYEYAFKNPEKAMQLMQKSVPTVDLASGVKEIQIIQGISQLPEDKKAGKPLGYINPRAMSSTVSQMATFFKVGRTFDPTTLYTNKYI
jgi:NitT/TauT family transport system substrate-binding protein